MSQKKYASLTTLQTFLNKCKEIFTTKSEVNTLIDEIRADVEEATSIPYFDLTALGLASIPLTGNEVILTTNTSAIREAMNNGTIKINVRFNIGFDLNGTATTVPLYLTESNEYQAIVNTVVQGTPVVASFTFTTTQIIARAIPLKTKNESIPIVNMSSSDGAVWTATIDGVEELTNGKTFLFIPNRTSSSTTLTLNVNGLGDVGVRRKMSSGTATLCAPNTSTLFFANRPTLLMYDTATVNGTPYWIALEFTKPSATDLYGKVPVQNGGWFSNSNTTDDDLVEAREAFGVYSKADHNWIQIYDSGETTEQINSFANINISGYKKLMMAIKCVNDTTNASTTRYGSAIFKATNGTTYQFPVFNSMFFGSETTTASIGFFEFIDGWIVCPQVVRSIKYSDFLTSTEGGTCTNMNNMGSGLMKCTNTLSTVTISNLDQNADFFFGVGSRVIIWGSVI